MKMLAPFLLLSVLLLSACETELASGYDDLVSDMSGESSEKAISDVSFKYYQATVNISDDSNTIIVLINTIDEMLTSQVAQFTYTGMALKKDGVLQENGVTVNDFSANNTTPAVYTVVAEDGSEREYQLYVRATGYEKTGEVTDLVITEWADAATDLDYIEIKNFSEFAVYIPQNFTICLGQTSDKISPESSLTLADYSIDDSSWISIPADGVRIGPGEFILLVDEDLNQGVNLETFRLEWGSGVEAPFKLFRLTGNGADSLIGTRDKLAESPAWLSSGSTVWCKTPPADCYKEGTAWKPLEEAGLFAVEVGKSTYSCIATGVYVHGSSDTEDFQVWSNGTKTTHSTPGSDYYE